MKSTWPEWAILLGVAGPIAMGVVLLVRRGLLPRRLALAGLAMFVLAVVLMVSVFAT